MISLKFPIILIPIKIQMKQTVFILSLALLAVTTLSFNIMVNDANDDKVKIDFYYESLCPYCQQFMAGALTKAANTKDFWKICEFTLTPYGNAKRTWNGSAWSFTCQHGPRECQGNILETCAIKLNQNDFYTKTLPFILCLESNSDNWLTQGKKCASLHGLNWDSISYCMYQKQGNDWQAEFAEKTENLVPAHTYVPWIVVNGGHSQSSESAVTSNMVRYVCSIYRGPEKIAACQN